MRPIKNYILLVDSYRRPSRLRNTHGRYRVGAKTPEEAVELLRAKIGFGSIRVYYECDPNATGEDKLTVGYKEVMQEVPHRDEKGNYVIKLIEPHHATAPRKTYVSR